MRIDVAYRDYEIRDLLALEQEDGQRLEAIRALFLQNRMVSAIGGDLDHKSCWEVLTSEELAARYFSIAERQLFRRHVLWTRIVSERRTETPDGPMDLLEYVRDYREELVLKPNRGYGGAGVALGAALSQSEWEALLEQALAVQHDPHRQWVVQAAATLPVHLFPVLDEQGRTHEEPFYAVMGFAPTDHGLGIIARVSQKQVVNVAQRGGLAAVLVGYRPEDLEELDALARSGRSRGAGAARGGAPACAISTASFTCSNGTRRLTGPAMRPKTAPRSSPSSVRCGTISWPATASAISLAALATRDDLTARERVELDRLSRSRRAAVALPQSLVAAFAETRSHCLAAWEDARRNDDYAAFLRRSRSC